MRIISEGGLFTLVLRSRAATKPGSVAHRFRKWVTGEVLPSIRKTGAYALPAEPPIPANDEPVHFQRQLVAEARQTFGVQAARELWFQLGLPVTPAMSRAPSARALPGSSLDGASYQDQARTVLDCIARAPDGRITRRDLLPVIDGRISLRSLDGVLRGLEQIGAIRVVRSREGSAFKPDAPGTFYVSMADVDAEGSRR